MKLSRKDFMKFAEMTAKILWIVSANYIDRANVITLVADILDTSNPAFDRRQFEDYTLNLLAHMEAK